MTGWPRLPRRPRRHLALATGMEHWVGLGLAHEVGVRMRVHELTVTAWHWPRLLLLHETWWALAHEGSCIEMMRIWHVEVLLVSAIRVLVHRCRAILWHTWCTGWRRIVLLLAVWRLILPVVVGRHLWWVVDLWRVLVRARLRRLILHLVDHLLQERDQLLLLSA